MKLKVAPGGSVLIRQILYRAGQIIPSGALTAAQIREHVNSGYVVAVRDVVPTLTADEAASLAAPGVTSALAIDAKGSPVSAPVLSSKWNLDPEGLRGYDLESLNVMVLERDDSLDPFDTEAEAIAWLSQDYQPPQQ